jgi:L-asparaginase II
MMADANYSPVVELTRGNVVESLHYGAAAVVDTQGQLLASWGDPTTVTFLRSAAKPFQALPFIEQEGDLKLGLTSAEVALICASHAGTDQHVAAVKALQAKIGVSENDLMCGSHPPLDAQTCLALIKKGEEPTPIRHMCSGKHTGMLAHAILRGLATQNYIQIEHPVQQSILAAFAEMCGLPLEQVEIGIDGCSAPNFAVPLRSAALAFARLADPSDLAPARAAACQRITGAMIANPVMVAGTGFFDTRLMQTVPGRIMTKSGAEGYQGVCLLPGALGPGTPALGIAAKIADGDEGGRAKTCLVLELLRQLGAISARELASLAEFGPRPIYNWRKIPVGEERPCFELKRASRSA